MKIKVTCTCGEEVIEKERDKSELRKQIIHLYAKYDLPDGLDLGSHPKKPTSNLLNYMTT
jgi:hypothetical protein